MTSNSLRTEKTVFVEGFNTNSLVFKGTYLEPLLEKLNKRDYVAARDTNLVIVDIPNPEIFDMFKGSSDEQHDHPLAMPYLEKTMSKYHHVFSPVARVVTSSVVEGEISNKVILDAINLGLIERKDNRYDIGSFKSRVEHIAADCKRLKEETDRVENDYEVLSNMWALREISDYSLKARVGENCDFSRILEEKDFEDLINRQIIQSKDAEKTRLQLGKKGRKLVQSLPMNWDHLPPFTRSNFTKVGREDELSEYGYYRENPYSIWSCKLIINYKEDLEKLKREEIKFVPKKPTKSGLFRTLRAVKGHGWNYPIPFSKEELKRTVKRMREDLIIETERNVIREGIRFTPLLRFHYMTRDITDVGPFKDQIFERICPIGLEDKYDTWKCSCLGGYEILYRWVGKENKAKIRLVEKGPIQIEQSKEVERKNRIELVKDFVTVENPVSVLNELGIKFSKEELDDIREKARTLQCIGWRKL
jgi:hypothetical protein